MARRKNESPWQTLTVKPLVGSLDTRSNVEDTVPGTWRYKTGYQMAGGDKLAVRPGHDRLFASFLNPTTHTYTNPDWHDQGDSRQTTYPTFLFQAQLNSGQHFLYAGTQERLGWLDESTGFWNIIKTGMGGTPQPNLPATRFKAAELQEQILFTNNVDTPFLSTVNTTTTSAIPSLNNIDASNTGLNLTQSAVVVEFNGFLLMMDVVLSGKRFSSRIVWCDYQLPASWQWYQNNSLAGFQDLDYGEEILAATAMAGNLYIFTTRAIWIGFISAINSNQSGAGVGNPVFSFQKVYTEKKDSAKCLAYPNMLVNEGNAVWYGGSDGIYYYDPYIPEPIREEWLYRASSAVYNDIASAIATGCCAQPIMEIFPDAKEFYLSWPAPADNPNGTCVNSRTLVVNYQYKSPDLLDYGYTALANYVPAMPAGDGSVCPQDALFIGAASDDRCLKQIGGIFSRTVCTNSLTGRGQIINNVYVPFTGQYAQTGLTHLLRALLPTDNFERDKTLRRFLVEITPTDQLVPCIVRLRLGVSYSEADPNLPDGKCSVIWYDTKDITLKCLATQSGSSYARNNLVPGNGFEWKRMVRGRFIYFELSVLNADGTKAIGGNAVFSRVETEIRLETKP